MQINRTLQYLNKLKHPHKTAIKISWLNPDETIYKEFTNEFFNINGSININYQDGARRTCTIVINNENNQFPIDVNHIWFGQKFQVWTGLYLDENGKDPYYISQGIYYIKNPKETYNPTTKSITLQGVDKWAFLDGSLFGFLTGTYRSLPNQDIREMATGLLKKNKYSNNIDETNEILQKIDPKTPIFDGFNIAKTTPVVQYINEGETALGCIIYWDGKNSDNLWCYSSQWDEETGTYIDFQYTVVSKEVSNENGVVLYQNTAISGKAVTELNTDNTYTIEQSIFAQPYTIQTEVGKSFADIFLEYKTMLMGKVYYDRDGYMRFEPISTSVSDYSDENRDIGWHFTITEQEFLGLEIENKFDATYNDVIVLGAITNGKQAKARIQNRDPSSEFSIDRIGIKTKAPYNSDQYYSDEQCIALGKYYAQTDMAMERAGSISSLPIYHLDVGQIVTVSTPYNKMSQEKFLVTAITYDLKGTMNLTITNIRYFTNWIAVKLLQDENGNDIAWVEVDNEDNIIEEV